MKPVDIILKTLCEDYNALYNPLSEKPTMLQRILNCESILDTDKEEFANDILDVAFDNDKKAEKFIKQSSFLIKNDGYTCVGKYKDWFWISSEDEGAISYCGTTLQELAYSVNSNLIYTKDKEDFIDLLSNSPEDRIQIEKLINNFLKICNDNGISFEFAEIKNATVDKNEENKFIEAVKKEFGFTAEPSYIGKVG